MSRPGWLVTYRDGLPTHPGTNRVWRSATTLIKANALPLSQTASYSGNTVSGRLHNCINLHSLKFIIASDAVD